MKTDDALGQIIDSDGGNQSFESSPLPGRYRRRFSIGDNYNSFEAVLDAVRQYEADTDIRLSISGICFPFSFQLSSLPLLRVFDFLISILFVGKLLFKLFCYKLKIIYLENSIEN